MRRLQRKGVESIMTKEDKENWIDLVKIRDDATKLFGYKWDQRCGRFMAGCSAKTHQSIIG